MFDRVDQLPLLPARPTNGHKGSFGSVLVIAGCVHGRRMIGAASLAANAAARGGAGLVRLLAPEPICDTVVAASMHATATALPVGADGALDEQPAIQKFDAETALVQSLVIGPGMGDGRAVESLSVRAVQQDLVPVVVDADALNALARLPDYAQEIRGRVVLTPHPGEYRRLAATLGIRHDPTDSLQREAAAGELAQRLGCIVVLKGAGTVVSDGHRSWVCSRGHPCLATGGTGDVLAGLIGGLIAQFAPPVICVPGQIQPAIGLFELACIGVQAHALAGEAWADASGASAGLLPMELCDLIPASIESMRARCDDHG